MRHLILCICNDGSADEIMETAKVAGARGGTIIHARGSAQKDAEQFLGITIQPEKEIIMTLTPTDNKTNIMKTICEKAHIEEAGKGICFSLPVNQVRGISTKYSFKVEKKEETKED